jgi:hypothetical protein
MTLFPEGEGGTMAKPDRLGKGLAEKGGIFRLCQCQAVQKVGGVGLSEIGVGLKGINLVIRIDYHSY